MVHRFEKRPCLQFWKSKLLQSSEFESLLVVFFPVMNGIRRDDQKLPCEICSMLTIRTLWHLPGETRKWFQQAAANLEHWEAEYVELNQQRLEEHCWKRTLVHMKLCQRKIQRKLTLSVKFLLICAVLRVISEINHLHIRKYWKIKNYRVYKVPFVVGAMRMLLRKC